MRKYKLVIFDFDGTLADSFRWFVNTINLVAKQFRFKPLDMTRLDEFRGCSARQMMQHAELSLWKLPMVTREMRRLMADQIDKIVLFDGVHSILEKLRAQGIKIAVVTSNSKENVMRVLGPENLAFISHFGCGASVFGKKSKVRAVVKASSVPLDDVLCVGDEIRDAEMAASLGVDFAGVSWGYTRPEELQRYSTAPLLVEFHDVLDVVLAS